MVKSHRPRCRHHPKTEQPEPPAEVDILMVHEEALVEAAGLEKGRAAKKSGSG